MSSSIKIATFDGERKNAQIETILGIGTFPDCFFIRYFFRCLPIKQFMTIKKTL